MSFSDFVGNKNAVDLLRGMIARDRLPHALLLSGPAGVGKYTLAQMLTKTLQCLDEDQQRQHDFCGVCRNCSTIALADDRHAAVEQAEQEREKLSKRPREIPLLVQHHADVTMLPPNGPLRLFQIEQARYLREALTFLPSAGRKRIFILPQADRMDSAASNALLKSLEEPPPYAVLLLTAENEMALLPTIRSRCVIVRLGPVPRPEVMAFLKKSGVAGNDQKLALRAAVSKGSPGLALRMDLERFIELRDSLLSILQAGIAKRDFGELFRQTQQLARQKEKLENLLDVLYSLFQDILHIETKASGEPFRNADRPKALLQIASSVGAGGVVAAVAALGNLERNLRRNVSMQIALESFAVGLEPLRNQG